MTRVKRLLRPAKSEQGYTMIELMISMAILGTITAAVTVLFVQASTAEVDMNRRFKAQQDARVAVDRMRREIHCAKAISPAGASAAITVTVAAVCPTAVGGVDTNHTYNVVSSGGRFKLQRDNVVLADYVAEQNAFNYTAPVTGTSLGKLQVTLPINITPADKGKEWRLVADIVLRNTTR
jgi:prepilin-type N-terminal cleavage/methylation domain-containing protein